jgi:serine/threonine-protein kinase HipA
VVEVFTSGHRAGTLQRSDLADDTILFGYVTSCRPEDAVSLTMPVVMDQYDSMGTVHPIFEMNLPEGALLERLRLMFAKVVPNLDDLALLSIIGQSQIGRLRYAASDRVPTEIPRHSIEEILLYSGAEDLFEELLQRYATYSGISGMQPKVLVSAMDPGVDRLTSRSATHIVKSFDSRQHPELAANEYFCLRAALHAGIPAARAELSANRRILVVERFDLRADGTYLGMEDFCVLNGLRSHGRYEGSYELLAKRIGQFVTPDKRRESLRQFFEILALSCAIENGDAHLKNFAVTYEHAESEVTLAPAYDLVSTTVYQRRDVLALALGDSKIFADGTTLEVFARDACQMMASEITASLERVVGGVNAAIDELREACRQHSDFADAGKRLITVFERGIARLQTRKKKRTGSSGTRSARAQR